ncbi:hypothetical protein M569_09321, partial [Genlisea aurea]
QVLGVERNASEREIQKAFHKLSLKYHPDKNKNKGAQKKFEEINNAYEILSDEQKRKNYDLFGDERGGPGFEYGNSGENGEYSYFTGGGPGQGGFSFKQGNRQNMGGQGGGSHSYSFSYSGPGSAKQSSFGFGLNDIFSNFFGGGSHFDGFSSFRKRTRHSAGIIPSVDSQFYKNEIVNKGITFLLLSYSPNSQGLQYYESAIEEATSALKGALRIGGINCDSEASLCRELGINPRRGPRIFVYSYASNEKGSLVEYDSNLDVKSLKRFCDDSLPKFSKRINLDGLSNFASDAGRLPKVLLLSSKKTTPVIWRALSGLYRYRFSFYDSRVHDVSDPSVKGLGVSSLPAIVGWLPNGERRVLKSAVVVKDLKSGIEELSGVLESFEKTCTKAKDRRTTDGSQQQQKGVVPLLSASNFNEICNEKVSVCFIGVFRSSKTREALEKVLRSVSQKSFSRSRSTASYAMVDGAKHKSCLEKLGVKSSSWDDDDGLVVLAYKGKRGGRYAAYEGEIGEEEIERFV